MRVGSLLPLAALLLAPALAGCETDRDGVSIDVSAALRAYREQLDRRPGRAQVERVIASLGPEQLNNLGVSYEREGRLEDAARAYRQAIRNDLWYVTAHVNLGNVLRKQGRTEEALSRYRKALTVDPDNFHAANNFADLCAQKRTNLQEAMAILSPFLETAGPHRPYGLDTLGWLYHLSGDHHRAAPALEAALGEAGEDDLSLRLAIHEHLSDVYPALGRTAEAQEHSLEAGRLRTLIELQRQPERKGDATLKGGEPVGEETQ